jgi:AP2 domain
MGNFRTPQAWHVAGDVAKAEISGRVVVIDAVDVALVRGKRWHINQRGVCSGGKLKPQILIMRPTGGQYVAFLNRDKCDLRRANLITVNEATVRRRAHKWQKPTSSQFKGVSWHKQAGRWEAYIKVDGKRRSLGLYGTEHAAAEAYDNAALKLFGPLAKLNSP